MPYLPANNLAYPVLITVGTSSGSGFFVRIPDTLYLATCKHVLFDYQTGALLAAKGAGSAYGDDLTTRFDLTFDFAQLLNDHNLTPHLDADVAVLRVCNVEGASKGTPIHGVVIDTQPSPTSASLVGAPVGLFRRFADVFESNEVFTFGYPTSIGDRPTPPAPPQLDPTRPLLRKGIVAGKNPDQQTMITDLPFYPGNSGGMVLQVSESGGQRLFSPIGLATALVPFIELTKSLTFGVINRHIANSGYSIVTPIDRVLELLPPQP